MGPYTRNTGILWAGDRVVGFGVIRMGGVLKVGEDQGVGKILLMLLV